VGAILGDSRGAGTILDNDPQVSLSVDDVSAPEAGQSATFTLSLSRESGKIVTVDYATGDGSAAAPSDYAFRSGTIIFMAGETSKTVSIALVHDALVEPDETFTLALSRAVNANSLGRPGSGNDRGRRLLLRPATRNRLRRRLRATTRPLRLLPRGRSATASSSGRRAAPAGRRGAAGERAARQ
jgi:hypothetical protein